MSERISVWLAALTGVSLVVFVCVQAVRTDQSEPLIALALVGAVLLVVALVYQRLESLKVSATSVELRLSKTIVELGAPKAAEMLEQSGLTGMSSPMSLFVASSRARHTGPRRRACKMRW